MENRTEEIIENLEHGPVKICIDDDNFIIIESTSAACYLCKRYAVLRDGYRAMGTAEYVEGRLRQLLDSMRIA